RALRSRDRRDRARADGRRPATRPRSPRTDGRCGLRAGRGPDGHTGSVARAGPRRSLRRAARESHPARHQGELQRAAKDHRRNGARSVAQLYDALHDPDADPALRAPTDTGNGGFTHPFFKGPKSTEELVQSRDAIVAWQRMTYGWLGRSPDYKAAFLGTLGAN